MATRIAASLLIAVALLLVSASATSADAARLASWLAPAPGADWLEARSSPTTLEGPFSSRAYSNYLQTVSPTTPSVVDELDALSFRSGYSRTWVQGGSNDQLTERVFEFGDVLGASAWFANLKEQNQRTKYLARTMPPLDGDPNSFGVVLKTQDYRSYRVEFVVSNLVFTVHVDSTTNDLTGVVVAQATAELRMVANSSPRNVLDPASPPPAAPSPELPLLGAALLAIAATGIAAVLWHRRTRARVARRLERV